MSRRELQLLNLLAGRVGIKTAKQLEEFKKKTQATSNEALIRRLALYVAADMTFKEVDNE